MPRERYERRLALGTIANAAGAVVGEALSLVAVGVAVNRVGGSTFGAFVLAQSLAQLPFLFESGIGQLVVRTVAGATPAGGDEDGHLVRVGASLYLALGAATLVLGVIVSFVFPRILDLSPVLDSRLATTFRIVALAFAVRMASGFVPRILVGGARLVALRAVGLARSVTLVVATLVLVDRSPTAIVSVAWAFLASEVVAAMLGLMVAGVPGTGAWWSRAAFREHIRASGPLVGANALALAATRADPVIVAVGAGAAATGTYGVVLRAYETGRSAIELLCLFLMPGTARGLARNDVVGVARLFRRALFMVSLIVWPFAIAVAGASPEILEAWVGRDLVDGPATLVSAMTLVVASVPGIAAFYVIAGAGAVRRALPVQVVGATTSFCLGVALVAAIGAPAVFVGSAAAAVLTGHRFLRLVTALTIDRAASLTQVVRRPAVLAVAMASVLTAARVVGVDGSAAVGVAAAALILYAVAAALWVTNEADRRRLVRLLAVRRGRAREH